jgi:hypothetical protein
MSGVFVFWDNSNIFISAQSVAEDKEGVAARRTVRISFDRLLRLARVERKLEYAIAVGSVPPELRHVWNRLENTGVRVELFERGTESGGEQGVDQALQVHMLRTAFDYNGDVGTVVLLTGDGKGFLDGVGFHADLERMHKRGWKIEVLAWESTCNKRMKQWVQSVGVFVALEDFYDSITFSESFDQVIRKSKALDLSTRPVA